MYNIYIYVQYIYIYNYIYIYVRSAFLAGCYAQTESKSACHYHTCQSLMNDVLTVGIKQTPFFIFQLQSCFLRHVFAQPCRPPVFRSWWCGVVGWWGGVHLQLCICFMLRYFKCICLCIVIRCYPTWSSRAFHSYLPLHGWGPLSLTLTDFLCWATWSSVALEQVLAGISELEMGWGGMGLVTSHCLHTHLILGCLKVTCPCILT